MSTALESTLKPTDVTSELFNLNRTRLYLLNLSTELKSWLSAVDISVDESSKFRFVLTEGGNLGYEGSLSSFEGETMVGVAEARMFQLNEPRPKIHVRLTPSSAMLHVAMYTTGEDSEPFLQGTVTLEDGVLVCSSANKLPNLAGPATRGPVIRMEIGHGNPGVV